MSHDCDINPQVMATGKGSSSSKWFWILSSRKTKKGHIDVEKTLNAKGVHDFWAAASANLEAKVTGKISSCCIMLSNADEGHSNGWRWACQLQCHMGHTWRWGWWLCMSQRTKSISMMFWMGRLNWTSAMLAGNSSTSWRKNCISKPGTYSHLHCSANLLFDRHHHVDPQTCQNWTNLWNEGFKWQMVSIVDAYITWQEDIAGDGLEGVALPVPPDLCRGTLPIQVVDVFCKVFPCISPSTC